MLVLMNLSSEGGADCMLEFRIGSLIRMGTFDTFPLEVCPAGGGGVACSMAVPLLSLSRVAVVSAASGYDTIVGLRAIPEIGCEGALEI